MPLGPAVRSAFGPYEIYVADAWRRMWMNMDSLCDFVRSQVETDTILEVGCGEGAITSRLLQRYPDADAVGLDITKNVGRLFRGDRARVEFRNQSIGGYANSTDRRFGLSLLVDVLHHVPPPDRQDLVEQIARVMRPGGSFVLKEWLDLPNLINSATTFVETRISGAPPIFESRDYWLQLIESVFGRGTVVSETRIAPWRNNFAMVIKV